MLHFYDSKAEKLNWEHLIKPRNTNRQVGQMNFCDEFLQQKQSGEIWQHIDNSRPSSSSSSLLSRSIGSPEYSSLLYNTPITCELDNIIEIRTNNSKITRPVTCPTNPPHQLSMQYPHGPVRKIRLPTPAKDDEAVTKAMLAVISSPTPSFSSNQTQSYPQPHQPKARYLTGAFKPYNSSLRHVIDTRTPTFRRESTVKRALAFLRRMSRMKVNKLVQETRLPTTNQLNHIMSERKRREKLNKLFEVLRGLLPPGTKKDKASVLSTTIETVGALDKQVFELKEKNKLLHRQLSGDETSDQEAGNGSEGVEIFISKVPSEATSEEQHIGMQVAVKDELGDITDLVIRLLECLKLMNIESVTILEAKTQVRQATLFNHVNIRLKIKTCEWNEQSFEEAMTRAVYDVGKELAG